MVIAPKKYGHCNRCGKPKQKWINRWGRQSGMVFPTWAACCCCEPATDCDDMGYTRTMRITLSGITYCEDCCEETVTGSFDVDYQSRTYDINGTYDIDFDQSASTYCQWFETISQSGLGTAHLYTANGGACDLAEFSTEAAVDIFIWIDVYRASGVIRRVSVVGGASTAKSTNFLYPGPNQASTASDTPGNPKLCQSINNGITDCNTVINSADCGVLSKGGTAVVSLTPV
jgi:hypothetical protein